MEQVEENKFPLKYLLILYENSARDTLYINHFEGFILLLDFLAEIEIPFYPILPIPKLHLNYELNEIAKLLNTHPSIIYQEYTKCLNQIL